MDSFRWISVVLSLILGFGVTRLLSASVMLFRSRSRAHIDWIPLAWAGCIFLWQLQFWWAIIELPMLVKTWTLGYFLVLIFLTMLLFVSAALVLPDRELKQGESILATFEVDGRWSLFSLAIYFSLALVADWIFWDISPLSISGEFMVPLILLPLIFLKIKLRWLQAAITLIYVPLSLWAAYFFSPSHYG